MEEDDDDDEDEDEADQWMVTDNEEEPDEGEEQVTPPPKKKRRAVNKKSTLQVTQHRTTAPPATTSATTTSAPPATTAATTAATAATAATATITYKSPLRQFANTVSPSTNSTHKSKTTTASSSYFKTPPTSSTKRTSSPPAPRQLHKDDDPSKPLPFTKGVVNPKGSHVHNHLPFLQQPKDASGKLKGEPGYDPRTLKISTRDWEKIYGGKMTNAVEQWWELKSRYFDTVLLFKTGRYLLPFLLACSLACTCTFVVVD
jgi:DNA mismatch repair protein MSH6